jgi:hypothetical protein
LGELSINSTDGRLYTTNGSAIVDLSQNDKITLSGDASGTSTNPSAGLNYSNLAVTLATVNSNTGTWGGANGQLPYFVVNGKGLVTAAGNIALNTQAVTNLGNTTDITSNATVGLAGLSLTTTGVSAGNYGSASSVPTVVVDSKGRVTSITTNAISTSFTVAGTTGTATVAGASTLTFASTNGVTIAVGATYANISTPQNIQTSASPTFAGGTFNGTIVASVVNAPTIGNTGAAITGTIQTAAQTNITSVGTLSGLTVGGSTTLNTATAGSLQALAIGNATPGTGAFTSLSSSTTATLNTITGASFQGIIGNATPAAGNFTTVTATNFSSGNINGTFGATLNGTVPTANISYYDVIASTTTAGTFYPAFFDKTSGNASNWVSSSLTYNPSTGNLTATGYIGTFYGTAALTGGSINGTTIGAGSASTGAFTTLSASGVTQITNSTQSTSTSSGALQVTGGIGVLGNVWIGGNLYVANIISTTQSTMVIQDSLVYLQSPTPAGNYNYDIGIYSDYSAPYYVHTGIARNNASNVWTFFSNVASEPGATTINWNDTGIAYDSVKAGSLVLANSTASSSTSTGALQVTGGAGIAGALYAGSVYDNGNRTLTTSTSHSNSGGDATVSGAYNALVVTLSTVNSTTGLFGNATYLPQVTVNAKGLVTAAANVLVQPAWSSITSTPTTLSGYGITDALSTSSTIDGGTF